MNKQSGVGWGEVVPDMIVASTIRASLPVIAIYQMKSEMLRARLTTCLRLCCLLFLCIGSETWMDALTPQRKDHKTTWEQLAEKEVKRPVK